MQLTLDEHMRAAGRDYLQRVLDEAGGNVSAAARIAGRNRTDFYKLLRKHGVEYRCKPSPFLNRGNPAWRELAG